MTDVMEFHFIEMGKLIKNWKADKLDPWNDLLARWLLMLGMIDLRNDRVYQDIYKELEDIAMKDETLRSAFNNWEEISLTREQRIAYESRLKHVLDEEAAIRERVLREQEAEERGEKVGKERGEKIGIELGKELGKELGIELGIELGKKEEKETIALSLLKKGLDIDTIVEVTGLDKQRLREINEESR